MTTRRDFLTIGAAAVASSAVASRGLSLAPEPIILPAQSDPLANELALEAISAAKDAGASYADARVGRYRRQSINTRDRSVSGVNDSESSGVGVRTLVNGSWGFAATSEMTRDGVVKAAREAVRLARAARAVQRRPVELAAGPEGEQGLRWQSSRRITTLGEVRSEALVTRPAKLRGPTAATRDISRARVDASPIAARDPEERGRSHASRRRHVRCSSARRDAQATASDAPVD